MSLETREIKLFWRDIPGFCWDIPEVPEMFEKNKLVFNFWPLDFLPGYKYGYKNSQVSCQMMEAFFVPHFVAGPPVSFR